MAVRQDALIIKNLYVTELLVNRIYLEWEYILKSNLNLSDFNITIQTSKISGIEYEDLSTTTTANLISDYTDTAINLLSDWENIYYRLKIEDTNTSDIYYSEPSSFFGKPDFILLEIRRRNELLLDRYITPKNRWGGPNCAIYIRKQYGDRCPDCYDTILEKRCKLDCDSCKGTGWLGGYDGPIYRNVNFTPETPQNQITEYGRDENTSTKAWMSFDPIIKPRDLIIEINTNKRWRVVQSPRTEKLRQVSHQNLVLYKIGRDDPEYKIEVPQADRAVSYFDELPLCAEPNIIYNVIKGLDAGNYKFTNGSWVLS